MTSATIPMMKKNPGGASGGYYWDDEESVVQVRVEDVVELEQVSHGDIYQPEVDHSAILSEVVEDEDEDEIVPSRPELEPTIVNDLAEAQDIASVTKRGPGRPRKNPQVPSTKTE
jgi:hypothetical protein